MPPPRRGEIYEVNFERSEGARIKKTRPAVIIQNDVGNRYAPHTIVAAIRAAERKGFLPVDATRGSGCYLILVAHATSKVRAGSTPAQITSPATAVGYVRVSTDEQMLGPEVQRAALAVKRHRGERTGGIPYGYRLAADGVHLEPCRPARADARNPTVDSEISPSPTHPPRVGEGWGEGGQPRRERYFACLLTPSPCPLPR